MNNNQKKNFFSLHTGLFLKILMEATHMWQQHNSMITQWKHFFFRESGVNEQDCEDDRYSMDEDTEPIFGITLKIVQD